MKISESTRRLVDEVLAEAAAGDDPALARAARAEQAYRQEQGLQRIRESYAKVGSALAQVGRTFAAMRDGLAEGLHQMCDETEAWCECVLPAGHDGAHECDCGGSWRWEDGEFVTVSWPGATS